MRFAQMFLAQFILVTVVALDTATAQPIFEHQLSQGEGFFVRGTQFSPSGDLLLVASGTEAVPPTPGEVRVYSTKSGQLLQNLKGHSGQVTALAFARDGKTLVTAGNDSLCLIWDMIKFRSTGELKGHSAPIIAVAVSPDGKYAVSGGQDKKLVLWNISTRQRTATFGGQDRVATSVTFDSKGQLLAAGYKTGAIRVWNVSSQKLITEWHAHEAEVGGLAFLPDDKGLASSSLDGKAKLWDATNGIERHAWRLGRAAMCLACSPDGKTLIIGCEDGEVVFCNVRAHFIESVRTRQKRDVVTSQVTFRGHDAAVTSIAVRRDGKMLASGGLDTAVNLWVKLPEFGE